MISAKLYTARLLAQRAKCQHDAAGVSRAMCTVANSRLTINALLQTLLQQPVHRAALCICCQPSHYDGESSFVSGCGMPSLTPLTGLRHC